MQLLEVGMDKKCFIPHHGNNYDVKHTKTLDKSEMKENIHKG